jgi:hypothetical protein
LGALIKAGNYVINLEQITRVLFRLEESKERKAHLSIHFGERDVLELSGDIATGLWETIKSRAEEVDSSPPKTKK